LPAGHPSASRCIEPSRSLGGSGNAGFDGTWSLAGSSIEIQDKTGSRCCDRGQCAVVDQPRNLAKSVTVE
jgi:hypothetical protein